jgi:hypothetical protein
LAPHTVGWGFGWSFEDLEQLPGEVSFEASTGLADGLALGDPNSIGAQLWLPERC